MVPVFEKVLNQPNPKLLTIKLSNNIKGASPSNQGRSSFFYFIP